MGPISRYLGPLVPKEPQLWQDPVPAVDHELIDANDIAALKAKLLASGLSISAAGLDRLGLGVHVPRHRQARRRQRRAHPPRAAEGLGGQQSAGAGQGAEDSGDDPEDVQRRAGRRQEEGFARRPDRARRLRGGREGGEGRRLRRAGAVHARTHRRVAGADRRRIVRGARAGRRRVPQLPRTRDTMCRPNICWSSAPCA